MYEIGQVYMVSYLETSKTVSLVPLCYQMVTINDMNLRCRLHSIPASYTTNPTERSAAANMHPSESDLESSVESHRAMAEQDCRALGECSVGFYR